MERVEVGNMQEKYVRNRRIQTKYDFNASEFGDTSEFLYGASRWCCCSGNNDVIMLPKCQAYIGSCIAANSNQSIIFERF